MRYRKSKFPFYFSVIFFLIVVIGIGYAYLNTTLGINGVTKISKNTWDVHFENLVVKEGSVSATSPATIDSNTTNVNFSVDLKLPNDYYEFNVDVVNKGSIDAMLSDVLKTEINANLAKYFDYTVTYSDGKNPTKKDLLSAGGKETINVKVIYKNEDELPTDDQSLNLSLTMTYVQADDSAVKRPVPVGQQIFALENIGSNGAIDTTDPEQTFITGTDPNNYVWYSGKLWRAVSKDTSDNSVKLVTQWNISTILYNPSGNTAFQGSYMEDWLNNTEEDGFLGTLYNYSNYIKTDSKWNATKTNATTKPAETTMVTDAVGLLNIYEYTKSYTGTTYSSGYLNDEICWWSLTPLSSSRVWIVDCDGYAYYSNPTYANGTRPAINLKSDVLVSSGDGSLNNPYKLKGDTSAAPNDKLNTRISGEYVKFNDAVYRIVNVDGDKTKIMAINSIGEKAFDTASSNLYDPTSSTNIGYYLNNDWYNSLTLASQNMIDVGTWYRGIVESGQSYRLAKDTTTNASIDAKVGLIRFGELMAGQFDGYGSNTSNWTVTPDSSSYVWYVYYSGYAGSSYPADAYGARPTINLKSDVYITSGTGLLNNPYILSQ